MTKKEASLKIVSLLRELVDKASREAVKFEWFEATSKELATLYEVALGKTNFKGFSLSSSMELSWLNPDLYLTEGSFLNRWVASALSLRVDAATPEEDLPWIIYRTLKKQMNISSFEEVKLHTATAGLRKLEAPAPVAKEGQVTYLVLSEQTSWEEHGVVIMQRFQSLPEDLVVITGERDTVSVDSAIQRAYDKFCEVKIAGSITPVNKEKLSFESPSLQGSAKDNLLVKTLHYRSKNGELHEFNYEDNPVPYDAIYKKIAQIEAKSTVADPPAASTRPARR